MLRPVVSLAMIAVLISACASGPAAAENPRPFLLNLTSGPEDLHAVWMGLQLAAFAVEDRPVTVFLNVHAPVLATTRAPAAGPAGKPAAREQIAGLMARGARVYVCEACATVLGLRAADLLPGVPFATREAIFGELDAGASVFTY